MDQLQAALDHSLSRASQFTRALFEHAALSATQVADLVNDVRNMTISTVSPNGAPHAAVVIAACLRGEFYVTVSDGSVLRRNVAHDPRVAFTVADRAHSLMGRGTVVVAARSLVAPDLIAALAAVSASGTFTPEGWDGLIFRIEIERIFAS